MTTSPPRRACVALALLGTLAAAHPAAAGSSSVRVSLTVPLPARLDMQGIERLLVTRFIVDQDLPEIDLNREVVTLLRRDLAKNTTLRVIDVEPPPLPEQPLAELFANTGFWRRMAETHRADMIIAGKASFVVSDRSGFVQRDEISPVNGQRVRRTVFVDREGFSLGMNLFFVRGSTGRLLYEDHLTGESTFTGTSNDRLTVLFSLFEQFEDSVLAIVSPRPKVVERFLFTE